MMSFDDFFTSRLKFGKYQLRTIFVVSFLSFIDGALIMYLTLLNILLFIEWSLTLNQLIILSIAYNLGLFFSFFLCALYADKIGRKNILIFGATFQFFTFLLTAFAQNIIQMIFLRIFYGLVFGLTLPIGQILITEFAPIAYRGRLSVLIQVNFVLGKTWILLLGAIFLVNLSEGNWRAIALLNSIPCLICLIGTIVYIDESARFQICLGEFDKGIEAMNKMGLENDPQFQVLQEEEINQLRNWKNGVFQIQSMDKSFLGLFNSDNLSITWRIWVIGILLSFVLGGIQLIVPFILNKEGKTLLDYFWTVIIEIPAIIIVYNIIDDEFCGRVKVVNLGSLFRAISLGLIWYYRERFLVSGLITFKFFTRITFLAFFPLVTESYNTMYRSLGVGTALCLSRAGSVLSPIITFHLYEIDIYLPFLLGAICKVIMILIMINYPNDRTQQPLDEKFSQIKSEKQE